MKKSQRPEHGNIAGDQPAYLYERYDVDGNFLKYGVTQDLRTRYTDEELAGGYLLRTARGPRRLMLKQECELVETNPRPLNFEPWAGGEEAMRQELPKEAISFSADFGGTDVGEALKPHFFALKRAFRPAEVAPPFDTAG